MQSAAPFLELVDIGKTYPGVVALDKVSLSIAPGEVIGLIGENGAGKSTLMKILGGVIPSSAGAIRVDRSERPTFSVADAIAAGIAFVHQELNVFDNLDVAANVFIGREPYYGWPLRLIDRKALVAKVRPLLDRLGVDFEPDTRVAQMSIVQRQLLEIVKALSLNSRLVIMDEPTSSLTLSETQRLLNVIAGLKADGVSVIFISHRLHEIEQCADRVLVLRDGKQVGSLTRGEIEHGAMIRLMIGRDLKALYIPPAKPPGKTVLDIVEARTAAYPGERVNLTLRSGEIVGLAGLVGSGRTELARAVFGVDRLIGGSLLFDGETIDIDAPREAIRRGVYLVPEDRKRSGLLIEFSLTANISLPDLPSYAHLHLINARKERDNAQRQKDILGIKAADVMTSARTLSGGNQQKVVLAKWLSMRPRVMILDEPTRGVDVGAKNEIYAMMRSLADSGVAILMISSDMEEVMEWFSSPARPQPSALPQPWPWSYPALCHGAFRRPWFAALDEMRARPR